MTANIIDPRKLQKRELYLLSLLFFAWGFISCLNDLLVPFMRGLFDLSFAQAMLVQTSFFSAFFLFAIPMGFLVDSVGYRDSIIYGLLIAATGCIAFLPAAYFSSYPLFLLALFVLATGICCLQVAANPYVVSLGPEDTGASRLNLTQGFNSLGTTLAPFFAATAIFSSASIAADADVVQLPYLAIAIMLLILALFFGLTRTAKSSLKMVSQEKFATSLGRNDSIAQRVHDASSELISNRSLLLGALAIFVYVGVEVSIGSLLIDFITTAEIGDMAEEAASRWVVLFWLGAMVGRFVGFFLLYQMKPASLLLYASLAAIFLVVLSVFLSGRPAMLSILAIGLFNSIMFPTIFALAIQSVTKFTSHGSGILCMAIVGGAFIPVLQGALADYFGLQRSLLFATLAYAYIALYAVAEQFRSAKDY